MLSSSVIPSALFFVCLPPLFPPQVPPPFLQLLPIVLDPAWHTCSEEFSRLFQPLSLGSLPSGAALCPLWVLGLPTQHQMAGFSSLLPIHTQPSSMWPHPSHSLSVMCVCLVTQLCPTLRDPIDCSPPGSSVHGDSPGKNTGVGCHALLQGIFPTQGLNPGLPHCRRILYCLEPPGKMSVSEVKFRGFPGCTGGKKPA